LGGGKKKPVQLAGKVGKGACLEGGSGWAGAGDGQPEGWQLVSSGGKGGLGWPEGQQQLVWVARQGCAGLGSQKGGGRSARVKMVGWLAGVSWV